MYLDKDWFDFFGYDQASPCFCAGNKKVIEKLKDEMFDVLIKEFVGLWAKIYSVLTAEIIKDKETDKIKQAKGVKKNVVKSEIPHQH